ncbi:MAG TPA: helix-hairpin-helix domain-containing protein [Solirubrobacteraceae bacterium]|jgi:DNA uptake protein ComE-like DNA-binding protein
MVSENLPVRRSRWPYISLIPIGFGAWAPIYAGVKARVGSWIALGTLWSVIVVAGFTKSAISGTGKDDVAGMLMVVGWIGAVATSFMIRSAYERRMGSPLLTATEAAEQRLRDRRRAFALAHENPSLAREIGVGRPDEAGAAAAGLVDVNNASVTALLGLPGIDGDLATRMIEIRDRIGGFSSLEDLGETLDLDGGLVERLRGAVVFLPRA